MLEREREQVAAASRRLAAEGLVARHRRATSARARGDRGRDHADRRACWRSSSAEQVDGRRPRRRRRRRRARADLRARPAPRRLPPLRAPGAVVHTHAPMATALVVRARRAAVRPLPDAAARRARCAWRPTRRSARPSSPSRVLDALEGRTAALMANHGAIAYGADARRRGRATAAARVGLHRLLARARRSAAARARRGERAAGGRRPRVERGYGDQPRAGGRGRGRMSDG